MIYSIILCGWIVASIAVGFLLGSILYWAHGGDEE